MSAGYVPFAFARNNHGPHNLPHWQDPPDDPSISARFTDDYGGAKFAPRNVPANFAWSHGKPTQAVQPRAMSMPLSCDNSYVSTAWKWRGPTIFGSEVRPSSLTK